MLVALIQALRAVAGFRAHDPSKRGTAGLYALSAVGFLALPAGHVLRYVGFALLLTWLALWALRAATARAAAPAGGAPR